MKYYYSIFLAAIFFMACDTPKTTFSIKGTLDSNIQADSVFVLNIDQKILAIAPVKAGKFELKGSVSEPQDAAISTRERGLGRMILENADYTYTYKDNRVYIKGGPIHDLVLGFEGGDEYNAALDAYENAMATIFADENKSPDEITPEENEQINKLMEAGINIENRNLNKVIDDPNTSLVAKAFALSRTQEWARYSSKKRVELLKGYEKELGGNEAIAKIRKLWEKMVADEDLKQSVAGGKMFKEVEAIDANGNTVKLSDVIAKNKFTILEFWASWCGPCRGEIPNLKNAYAKYKSKGLEIFAVSLDNKKENWLKALEEENTPWLNTVDTKAFEAKAAKDYVLSGVPASFLIGQDGKILVSDGGLRGKQLEETLSQYMP